MASPNWDVAPRGQKFRGEGSGRRHINRIFLAQFNPSTMLLQLPLELVLAVTRYLEHGDASRLARVNRLLYKLVQPEVDEYGALTCSGGRWTILHRAAEKGHERVIRAMLHFGADVDVKNFSHETPLFVAAKYGRPGAARILIENGADVNLEGMNGQRPLGKAAASGSLETVERLLDHGATMEWGDDCYYHPIHSAAMGGNANVVQKLITLGADIERRSRRLETPLYCAARAGRLEVCQVLLDHGALIDATNDSEETPLHIAAQENQAEMVEWLVAYGASINARDMLGFTPLHCAAELNHQASIQKLAELRAEINEKDNKGRTPLERVMGTFPIPEIVRTLVKHGASVDAITTNGKSIFQSALDEYREILDRQQDVEESSDESYSGSVFQEEYSDLDYKESLKDVLLLFINESGRDISEFPGLGFSDGEVTEGP